MATVEVTAYVEIEDYLDQVALDVLEDEIRRRRLGANSQATKIGDVELWTPSGLADDLRLAFYARNASRFEVLLTVLQPHIPTIGLHARAREHA